MSVQNIAQENASNAKRWAMMLAAPQDHLVRAPSSTPFLASKTRFVRSIDIPYTSTRLGQFTVAMSPSIKESLMITGIPGPIPTAGPGKIVLTSLQNIEQNTQTGLFDTGFFTIKDANTGAALGTVTFHDLGYIHPNFVGKKGIPILPNGAAITITVGPGNKNSKDTWFKYGLVSDDGTISFSATQTLSASPVTITSASPAATVKAILFYEINSDGTPTDGIDTSYSVSITLANGQIPNAGDTQSFDITKSSLLDAGKVAARRCVAMSLLVTNMAAPIEAGGELVVARAPLSLLKNAGSANIMNAIKQLPEERFWRSGAIVDGGYAWYLPDDLESYEPHQRASVSDSENLLYACGNMSNANGMVRIIATWNYEFYTPVQLFSRDSNQCYSEAHRTMWQELWSRPAVSANAGHLALLAAIAGVASQIYSFYSQHKRVIDPMVQRTVAVGQDLFRQQKSINNAVKQKKQSQQKKKNVVMQKKKKGKGGNSGPQPGSKAITYKR